MSHWVHLEYNTQRQAQAQVKSLIKRGLDPSNDIRTTTLPNGRYRVAWLHRESFGLFGA